MTTSRIIWTWIDEAPLLASYTLLPIIQKYLEASRKGNDYFLKLQVSVATSGLAAWNIVNPVNSRNSERNVLAFLEES